jgi:FkbM family methyltransferase
MRWQSRHEKPSNFSTIPTKNNPSTTRTETMSISNASDSPTPASEAVTLPELPTAPETPQPTQPTAPTNEGAGTVPPAARPHLFVSILVGGHVHAAHHQSLELLRTAAAANGIDLTISKDGGTGVDRARNRQVAVAMSCGTEKAGAQLMAARRPSHFMFIDSDIVFDPMDVIKFVVSGLDIVGGAYPRKDIDWKNVAAAVKRGVEAEELEAHSTSFILNGLLGPGVANELGAFMEVEELGTGFLCFKLSVIDTMVEKLGPEIAYVTDYEPRDEVHHMFFKCDRDPRCELEVSKRDLLNAILKADLMSDVASQRQRYEAALANMPKTLGRYLTEDYNFCRQAMLLGFKVYLAVNARLGHIGQYIYRGDLQQASAFQLLEAGSLKPVDWHGNVKKDAAYNPVAAEKPKPVELVSCPPGLEFLKTEVLEYEDPGLPELKAPFVLDIGACIGSFAVWAIRKWAGARGRCFEPGSQAFEHLLKNAPDGWGFSNNGVGAAESNGNLTYDRNLACNKFKPSKDGIHHVVAAAALPPCDVLKVDTEGMEVEILFHYRFLKDCKVVFYEWHTAADRVTLKTLCETAGLKLLSESPQTNPEFGVARWVAGP